MNINNNLRAKMTIIADKITKRKLINKLKQLNVKIYKKCHLKLMFEEFLSYRNGIIVPYYNTYLKFMPKYLKLIFNIILLIFYLYEFH